MVHDCEVGQEFSGVAPKLERKKTYWNQGRRAYHFTDLPRVPMWWTPVVIEFGADADCYGRKGSERQHHDDGFADHATSLMAGSRIHALNCIATR